MAIEETERILETLGYKIRATEGVSIFLEESRVVEENQGEKEKRENDPIFEQMAVNADYMIMFLPEKDENIVSTPIPPEILCDLSITTKSHLNITPEDVPLLELRQLPTEGQNAIILQNGAKRIFFFFNKIQNKVRGRLQTNRGGRWKPNGEPLPDIYISDLEIIINAGKMIAEGIRSLNEQSVDGTSSS